MSIVLIFNRRVNAVLLLVVSLIWAVVAAAPVLAEQASPDLRYFWRFDKDKPGDAPAGFSAVMLEEGQMGTWKVEADPQAPSVPNRLAVNASCPGAGSAEKPACLQVLLVDGLTYEYPDLAVRVKMASEGPRGGAGLVFRAKDARNFYAAIVDLAADSLEVVHVVDGQLTVIGREPVKRRKTDWHLLRVQHNTILSKDFLEISFDGQIAFTHWDKKLGAGQIGLVTRGDAAIWFDNFDAVQLFSQRPLSPPAAY